MENLNVVDYIVLTILGFSTLIGLTRGFVKEVISVLTWVAAFIVAMTFTKPLAAAFTGASQVQTVVSSTGSDLAAQSISVMALGLSFVGLFVATLIIGSIAGYIFSSAANLPMINLINRVLGAGFGLIRGYLIVIVLIFLVQLTALGAESLWVQSYFVNNLQPEVQWLGNRIQPGIESLKATASQTWDNVNQQYVQPVKNSF